MDANGMMEQQASLGTPQTKHHCDVFSSKYENFMEFQQHIKMGSCCQQLQSFTTRNGQSIRFIRNQF
jgi:hypothetical protein